MGKKYLHKSFAWVILRLRKRLSKQPCYGNGISLTGNKLKRGTTYGIDERHLSRMWSIRSNG